jgi:hypothetical protein
VDETTWMAVSEWGWDHLGGSVGDETMSVAVLMLRVRLFGRQLKGWKGNLDGSSKA